MNKTKWIIFTVIVLGIFTGLYFMNKSNSETTYSGDAKAIITEGPIPDHVKGTTGQKVTLIEYADYQCPACSYTFQTTKNLTDKYPDKLTFIFRNYPLTNIHPNALAAATAAEAAGLQGKYFEMYSVLYQNQSAWSELDSTARTQAFQNYAQQIGLDVEKYKSDLNSKDITTKINRDVATARNTFKISGTPTFILNGNVVDSSTGMDSEAFSKLIDDAVNKAYPQTEQAN